MGSLDRVAQEIRMRRFAAAALTSLVFAMLVWTADRFGLMAPGSLRVVLLLILLCIAGFFLLIHTGLNESLADPSMTLPMVLASSSVNSYVLYSLHEGRGAFLLIYLMSMVFGVFRLNRQELLAVAGFIITSYAVVIWQLQIDTPSADFTVDRVQWIVLACVLVWFSFMGGYIGMLINRLGQSEYDELTGAYTRRRILEILRHEKLRADRSKGPLSVCLLDIDRLKRINDTFGHQGGDRHLRRVATAVQQELRGIDYLGRYGGDEFLVVLSETGLRGAQDCAERIRHTLARLGSEESSHQPPTTISVGIAEYLPGETLTHTIGRADQALYAAKSCGRDRIECAAPQGGEALPG